MSGIRYNPFTGKLDLIGAGAGSVSPWVRSGSSVAGSGTSVVDSVDNSLFKALKYFITVFNDAELAYESFELSVLNNNGSYRETRSNRILDNRADVGFSSNNNAGTFELAVTNNETFNVQVELARLNLS